MNPISLEKRNKLRIIIFCALGIFLLLSFFISISCGAITITYTDIYTALTGGGTADTTRIVNVLRLPRTLVTALTGANLALAGCILQGVLRNPLADPGIIGVSAGAGLFAMFLMILAPEAMNLVPAAAFIGAVLSTGLVFSLPGKKASIHCV